MSRLNTRFGQTDSPPLKTLRFNELTWVNTAGKLDVSAAASGTFTHLSANYGLLARDCPFGYIPLFNAQGEDHWDVYSSLDFEIIHDGNPGDANGGAVAIYVGVQSATNLLGPSMGGGVLWQSDRLNAAAIIGRNGVGVGAGTNAGATSVVNRVKGNLSFSGNGCAEVNATMSATSQNNVRSFQAHADQMYLVIAFENAGSVASWTGVNVKYRLNK